MQRALIQYRDPKNYELVKEALLIEHREDLIGFDKKCLIPPRKMTNNEKATDKRKSSKRHKSEKKTKHIRKNKKEFRKK